MKHFLTTVIVLTVINISFSQNFSELNNYEFPNAESYKAEENKVLLCTDYLFNNPANKAKNNRLIAIQYIIKWMSGTPDYTFEIGTKALDLTKGSTDLFGLYMAAITKVALQNTDKKLDVNQIHEQAQNILVEYCANPDNNIKPNKAIKKILKKQRS